MPAEGHLVGVCQPSTGWDIVSRADFSEQQLNSRLVTSLFTLNQQVPLILEWSMLRDTCVTETGLHYTRDLKWKIKRHNIINEATNIGLELLTWDIVLCIQYIVSWITEGNLRPLAQPNFSTSHKGHNFRKTLLSIKYVFLFSLQLLYETFLILRRIQQDIAINVETSSCKVPVKLVGF